MKHPPEQQMAREIVDMMADIREEDKDAVADILISAYDSNNLKIIYHRLQEYQHKLK